MQNSKALKQKIYHHLVALVEDRISIALAEIDSTLESRNNETKSSAGDKYETGRAMLQVEQSRNEAQLAKAHILQKELAQLNLDKQFTQAEPGSLVFTEKGSYFISIGIGQIEVEGNPYFAISLASPIGQELFQKQKGDKFSLQGTQHTILSIY